MVYATDQRKNMTVSCDHAISYTFYLYSSSESTISAVLKFEDVITISFPFKLTFLFLLLKLHRSGYRSFLYSLSLSAILDIVLLPMI